MSSSGKQQVDLHNRESKGKRPVVLIIDDNPRYAKLFELLSDRLNINAHLVLSCIEGMEAMNRLPVDLVIMDWFMPEIDGLACTRRIREMERATGQHIPIIGVSGYTRATREECLQAGMDDFLTVPFTLEALQEKLCRWLKKHSDAPIEPSKMQ